MTKNIKQYIPIFVSSTYADLMPYRKAVWDILDKLKLAVSGMGVFGARSEEPLKTCLDEVTKCNDSGITLFMPARNSQYCT
jgi:hypothetical protein